MPHNLSETDRQDWELYLQKTFSSPEVPFPITKQDINLSKRLDLHGLTIQEAFHKFGQFIESHAEAGTKQVMIITGKSGQISREFTNWCWRYPKIRRWESIVDSRGGVGSYRIHLR